MGKRLLPRAPVRRNSDVAAWLFSAEERFPLRVLHPATSHEHEGRADRHTRCSGRDAAQAAGRFGCSGAGSSWYAHHGLGRLRRCRLRRSGPGIGRRSRGCSQSGRLRYSERNPPRLAQPVIGQVRDRLLVAGRGAQRISHPGEKSLLAISLTDGLPSLTAILRQLRAALPTRTAFVGVQPEATHYRTLKTAG